MKKSDRSAGRLKKLGAALALGLAASLALSACAADDPLAQQAAVGDNKNYIAGDGSVTEYAASDRGEPLAITGTQYDGTVVDSEEWAGQVTVVNFWYAACAPCREEAPDLVALHDEYASAGTEFYGVNIRDTQRTAEAFERSFEIPYPSLDDQDGGVLLAMTSYVPPQAVPTTLVIDKEGRVSARILGLADKSTLAALIDAALAE
ncbi:peroxiredoxin [Arthrobacter sp. CAN_A212]|uniref:TlpA family protein disulfide reductase n=1 Tax=Arthrobacter sp. CAN_A212 TaxID=2787719 RepID=UPI0018CB0C0C